jgi:Ca-activated chloride channel family protein
MMIVMFQFAQPLYLLLWLVLPLVVWWCLRRRARGVPHPSLALFEGLPVGRARLAEYGGLTIRVLALALLVVALAQPRWPDLRTRLDTDGIAIMLVVDVSGSMAERDFVADGEPIRRLDAVKRVFRVFVSGGESGFQGRSSDLLGLVTFATRPETTCPLTLNHSTLLRLLETEEPRGVPGESETNLSDAVTVGLGRLRAAGPRRKVLVLLTDGEHNQAQTRSEWTPRQVAQVAASLGIPIYAIDAGAPVPSGDEADAELSALLRARDEAVATLQDMARLTRGQYFAARDIAALGTAYRAIDRLERTTIASFQYRRYHEVYPWVGLSSFVLFVMALVLEQTLWRRLP